LIKGSKDSDRA